MRISDWSSDVCSSDLAARGIKYCWQIGRQMRTHRHRPNTRPAPAMRDAEGLVQIQVRNVRSELAWLSKAHHGVHVGPVQVNLATGKLGRASCRERVCQYGEISVDAVT